MRYGSCFAGVGGFDLALERAGWECAWQIEKDGPCRKVLERHFPGVPQFGDIREVDPRELGPVDLVCGGWPCQDLSVAGRRAGLAGSRSELFWELHRLVAALRPRWIVYENVPGLLSSDGGRDFGAILGAVGELGYGYAYRVLDAQHFGVPQRRRRVFIVGCLGDGAAAAQVLLEPEGGAGDFEAGGEARPDLAGTLGGGSGERGWAPAIPNFSQALRGSTSNPQFTDHALVAGTFVPEISPAISGPNDPQAEDQAAYIAHQVDGSEAASTLRGFGHGWQGQHNDTNAVVARPLNGEEAEVASTRRGHSPTQSEVVVAGVHANQRGEVRISERAGCLGGSRSGKQYEGVMETISSNPRNRSGSPGPVVATGLHQVHGETSNGSGVVETDTARALDQQGFSGGRGGTAVAQGATVRRLTPTEYERLQGFPDGWTDGQPDSRRYAQLGNAVAVPVVEWIVRRIP